MSSDPVIHRLFMGHVLGPIGELPIYAYAIVSGDDVLLIDSGMSSPPDPEILKIYPMYARTTGAALADHRLTIDDITHLALSHLDHDHAGNNLLFRTLPVFVGSEELDNARNAHSPEFRSTWDGDDVDFRVLEGDGEIVPGVVSLHTPGHTPGHQSFLVSRGDKQDLIVGDAAYNNEIYTGAEGYTPDHPVWPIQVRTDRDTWLGSINRLRALDVDRVYFSHDDKVWARAPDERAAGAGQVPARVPADRPQPHVHGAARHLARGADAGPGVVRRSVGRGRVLLGRARRRRGGPAVPQHLAVAGQSPGLHEGHPVVRRGSAVVRAGRRRGAPPRRQDNGRDLVRAVNGQVVGAVGSRGPHPRSVGRAAVVHAQRHARDGRWRHSADDRRLRQVCTQPA